MGNHRQPLAGESLLPIQEKLAGAIAGASYIPLARRERGLGEKGGASLKGKGGRVGFRKNSSKREILIKRTGVRNIPAKKTMKDFVC